MRNNPPSLNFCGRVFTGCDLILMQQVSSDCAELGITEISRTICELLDWKRPSGRLKDHECRTLLERLNRQRQLTLPERRRRGPRGPRRIRVTAQSDPGEPIVGGVKDCE